jgi:hypothetical protein
VFANASNGEHQFAQIAGSQAALAVEIVSGGVEPGCSDVWCFRDIYSGPPAGPLSAVGFGHCALSDQGAEIPAALDADGNHIIYYDCPHNSVEIMNTSTGARLALSGGQRGLRIAGRYASWVVGSGPFAGDNTIEVYDWKAKSRVYVVPKSVTGGGVGDYDLSSDGTVVLPVAAPHQQAQLGWISPQSRHLHRIPVAPRDSYAVRIVGKTITFERGQQAVDIPRAEVGLTDRAGHVKLLATGADMGVVLRQFDFDGTRVAWYAFACTGARLHLESTQSRVIHESLKRCRLRFNRPPHIYQDRVVDLAVNCYGYAQRCKGVSADLTLPDRPQTLVGHGKNAHNIELTAQGIKLLKAHQKLRVRAHITITDLIGTRERRTGLVTLRRQ